MFEARPNGNPDLFRLDLSNGAIDRLTTDSANDFRPAVSPDGRWLAFQSNRGGTYQLYLASLDYGQVRALTTVPGNSAYPAWSPDGRQDGRHVRSLIAGCEASVR